MFKERTVSRFFGGLLGALSAFGSMGALATGMRFGDVSMITVLAVCIAGSALFAFLAGRKIFLAVPVLLLLGSLWLWYDGALEIAAEAFLHQITTLYDMGYGWGVIRWLDSPVDPQAATLVFCLLALVVSLAVTWSVVRGKSGWLAVPLVFLPLVPCLVLTDTVPAAGYIFLQLLSVILLLFSQAVRKRSMHQGNKLLALLTLPVAVVLGLLFFLMPKEGYQGAKYAQDIEVFFLELFQIVPEEELPAGDGPGYSMDSSGRVQLSNVGNKVALRIPVLAVTAEETGLMYLRGTAYDTYRGVYWDEDVMEGRVFGMSEFYSNGEALKTVTISSRSIRDVLYFPYAPQSILVDGSVLVPTVKGKVENEENLREYTVQYSPVTVPDDLVGSAYQTVHTLVKQNGEWVPSGKTERVIENPSLERYLQLPQATRDAARELLDRELPELKDMKNDWEKAQAIAAFVRSCATYDLQTDKMPKDSKDFALWFLEESETGYCTHFATATAVLLRAADVPCRYVTGYLARTQANQTVSVLQRNAHAWVEVLVYTQGWVVLEATPGGGVESTATASVIEKPEVTEPSENPQATEPEQPSAPGTPETTETPELPTEPPELPTEPQLPAESNPAQGTEPGEEMPDEPFVLPVWAKILLWIGAAILGMLGQWKLRVWLRLRRYKRGANNARALALWQDIETYARLLKTEPTENLLELARKARFSQYRLTKEELAAMVFGLKDLRRTLWREKRWKRLYARIVLALY